MILAFSECMSLSHLVYISDRLRVVCKHANSPLSWVGVYWILTIRDNLAVCVSTFNVHTYTCFTHRRESNSWMEKSWRKLGLKLLQRKRSRLLLKSREPLLLPRLLRWDAVYNYVEEFDVYMYQLELVIWCLAGFHLGSFDLAVVCGWTFWDHKVNLQCIVGAPVFNQAFISEPWLNL